MPLFISFSTSYRELDSAVRRPTRRIGKLRGEDVSRSLKLLCLKRNIENLSTIQEKSGYLLGQRGNERFVGNPEVTSYEHPIGNGKFAHSEVPTT